MSNGILTIEPGAEDLSQKNDIVCHSLGEYNREITERMRVTHRWLDSFSNISDTALLEAFRLLPEEVRRAEEIIFRHYGFPHVDGLNPYDTEIFMGILYQINSRVWRVIYQRVTNDPLLKKTEFDISRWKDKLVGKYGVVFEKYSESVGRIRLIEEEVIKIEQ